MASAVTTTHFAVGLVVDVKDGAKPVGWGDDPFTESVPKYRAVEAVAGSEEGCPFGSFSVGGWYWAPEDVVVK